MPTEPLIHWPDPLLELVSFLALFLAVGAVGFRFAALPGVLAATDAAERAFAQSAARRAAMLGLVCALVSASLLVQRLPEIAARRQIAVSALIGSTPPLQVQIGLLLLAVAGFAMARSGVRAGWPMAAAGVLLLPLRNALFGQFARVVNPVHELAGGLWIGTLALLVFAGLRPALRALPAERRGPVVARMVNGFSPLALCAVALLASMGVITAVRHLKRVESLWTTPYGWTFLTKLAVVAVVLGYGAYNWRRQKARLGSEAGAIAMRGSATAELVAAGVVLAISAVLVSLPSPE